MLSRQVSNSHPVRARSGVAQDVDLRVRFLHIVRCAVNQRRHLLRTGKSRPVDISRLQTWLDRNPHPSVETLKAFPFLADLSEAMPHHAAGQKMLEQARRIILGVPLDPQ